MIGRLWRELLGVVSQRRRDRLGLRYCSHCWDYTTCWQRQDH